MHSLEENLSSILNQFYSIIFTIGMVLAMPELAVYLYTPTCLKHLPLDIDA